MKTTLIILAALVAAYLIYRATRPTVKTAGSGFGGSKLTIPAVAVPLHGGNVVAVTYK